MQLLILRHHLGQLCEYANEFVHVNMPVLAPLVDSLQEAISAVFDSVDPNYIQASCEFWVLKTLKIITSFVIVTEFRNVSCCSLSCRYTVHRLYLSRW